MVVAHVLMVESWVGAMGRLLPRAIAEAGHEFTFLTRDLGHYLRAWRGPGQHPLLGAKSVLHAETNGIGAALAAVAEAHAATPFDGVLTACDYYLETAAVLAARLGLPGTDPGAVRRARHKDAARRAMAAAGLPTPGFATAQSWTDTARAAADIGYPLVVKPVDLCAGMLVRRVDDAAGLRAAYEALRAFPRNARGQERAATVLLEEYLDGPEVSVETVTVDGRTSIVGVTDKTLAGPASFIELGHAFPAPVAPALAEAACRLVADALSALGVDRGVAHTEVKLTASGPYVVEVNLRPAGNCITELVRRVAGVDLPAVLVRLAVGEEPASAPAPTGVGGAAIRFVAPRRAGRVAQVRGASPPAGATDVVDWHVDDLAGREVAAAADNNGYVGRVMVVAADPAAAAARAAALAAGIEVVYADGDA